MRIDFKSIVSMESMAKPAVAASAGVGAIIAPYVDMFYGIGRTNFFIILLIVIAFDWITAVAAALKDKTYSSEYGINGILRTLFILGFPALANFFDNTMGTPGYLFYGVIFSLIYHTFNSMTANAYRAGWERFIPRSVIQLVSSEIKAKADRAANLKGDTK